MMPSRFSILDNTPVNQAEVAKCHSIAERLRSLPLHRSAERNWLAVDYSPVYQGSFIGNAVVDENFLNNLRTQCPFFTGYPLGYLDDFDGRTPTGDHSVLWVNDKDWIIETYNDYVAGLTEDLLYRPPLRLGESGFNRNGICVNPDTIAYQERITLLHALGVLDRLRTIADPTIVEIGGGYGALAHALLTRFPQARYVIVDLPSSLLFSACYLAVNLPDLPITVTDDLSALCRSDFTGIAFVPDYAVPGHAPLAADLGINTLSFAEMPESTVASYASFLFHALKNRNGVLFEQNFGCSTHGETFSDPEAVLKRFFDFQIRCRAKTRWGRASLWTTASHFNRDLNWPPGMLGVLAQREPA